MDGLLHFIVFLFILFCLPAGCWSAPLRFPSHIQLLKVSSLLYLSEMSEGCHLLFCLRSTRPSCLSNLWLWIFLQQKKKIPFSPVWSNTSIERLFGMDKKFFNLVWISWIKKQRPNKKGLRSDRNNQTQSTKDTMGDKISGCRTLHLLLCILDRYEGLDPIM